jgi:putative zinc finger/helix-turn-helix YgiT family protein
MAQKNEKDPKARPFPWLCSDCFTRTVVPTVTEYTSKVKHDGTIHELHFPALEIPRCQTCGETYTTTAVDEQINDALRAKLRLLTPAQIRQAIERLGLKQQQIAERIGVAAETISRWVNGALIQSRAMDNLLRLFFALPQVREVLQGPSQDPNLGTENHHSHDRPEAHSPALGVNRIRGKFRHLRDPEKASQRACVFQFEPGVN